MAGVHHKPPVTRARTLWGGDQAVVSGEEKPERQSLPHGQYLRTASGRSAPGPCVPATLETLTCGIEAHGRTSIPVLDRCTPPGLPDLTRSPPACVARPANTGRAIHNAPAAAHGTEPLILTFLDTEESP